MFAHPTCRCSVYQPEKRSPIGILHAPINIKDWLLGNLPDVETVRPSKCPQCGIASRCRDRGRLWIHGHGRVKRVVWGPARDEFGNAPGFWDLLLRRYRCLACKTVIRVAPLGLLPRRRYSAATIALCLAYWAMWNQPPAEIRDQFSPWPNVAIETKLRWPSLERWVRETAELRLWRTTPALQPVDRFADVSVRSRRGVVIDAIRRLVTALPESTIGVISALSVFAAAQLARGPA